MENDEKAHRKALKAKAKLQMQEDERRRARQAELNAKYVVQNTPRMGQKRSEVILILGVPAAIDIKVTQNYSKEILKYQPYGTNRYKLKISLKNGLVSEWEHKK